MKFGGRVFGGAVKVVEERGGGGGGGGSCGGGCEFAGFFEFVFVFELHLDFAGFSS